MINYPHMLKQQLQQLGFHKNEIIVYLSLFELGQSKAGKIIEHTKLHRNLVYTALENLEQKKLISKLEKGKVFVFEINSPETIRHLMDEKTSIANEVVKELNKKLTSEPRDVKIYEGNEGIITTREIIKKEIEKGESYSVMGVSYSNSNSEITDYFSKFNKYIIKKGANFHALISGNEDKKIFTERNLTWNKNARYLPFTVDSPMWFALFRDTLNISLTGDDPITFSIKSAETARAFKKYFDYFWEQKVKMESGIEALKKTIYEMLNELNAGEEYLVLGASAGDNNSEVQKLYDQFHTDRIKKGVITKMLVYSESLERIKRRYTECGDSNGRISIVKTYATTPATPMQINMFHNKAFIILYGEEPTIIHFDQKEIHDGFKKYFDELWDQETQILTGAEVLKDLWLEGIKNKEIRWIGARGYFVDNYPELFKKIQHQAEHTPDLKCKLIIDPEFRGHTLTRLPWVETKYNLSGSRNPIAIWLFGNKVLIVNWADKIPVIFLSTNKFLIQSYSDYFDELWNKK